jgi:hypothetical protein
LAKKRRLYHSEFRNAVAAELCIARIFPLTDWFCYGIWSCAYH